MASTIDDVFESTCSPLRADGARDLLVYIHIPFCRYLCTFCDWVNQYPARELISGKDFHARYVDALCRQIRDVGPRLAAAGYVPRLIYWGGGTPTILDSEHFRAIMQALHDGLALDHVVEHSIEATPDSVEVEKVRVLRELGVGRISVGVQSFDEEQLRKAGRGHSASRVRDAVQSIQEAGVENYNLDVMIGLPGQSLSDVEAMSQNCLDLRPAHVTLYAYRPTSGTRLAVLIRSGRRELLSNNLLVDGFERAQAMLADAGYHEYITGYYARDLRYKYKGEQYYFGLEGDWFGFGAGANSVINHHQFGTRRDDISFFIEHPFHLASCERFSLENAGSILFKLRLAMLTEEGVRYDLFRNLFGIEFSDMRRHPLLQRYVEYFRQCGAEFVDDGERLYVRPDTRTRAHLRSYGMSPEYQSAHIA
ncbi:MAG: coproporphyrinogen-III oxidase family protein [Vicinamibacterales bacterium]